MSFKGNLIELVQNLESQNEKAKDIALNRVIDILKTINDLTDLKREKGLIIRIVIDSVNDITIGETILTFIHNYTSGK
ncbi:hypothetical protein [Parabacteroides sp. FAFU027]|uniref:hypothetical protein n=1 Tax=Parabacteroides sp. FAFU027 TaxID=2922715 RepID=UPI001FAF0ECC|nr:hypothetical protein [Parabacteroides sp. FAFU027]